MFNIFLIKKRGQGIFCGYREKLSSFNKRRKDEKQSISRRDVQKFLQLQNNSEELTNPALAEALAKLKLK